MKFKRSWVSLCAFEELSFVSKSLILATTLQALTTASPEIFCSVSMRHCDRRTPVLPKRHGPASGNCRISKVHPPFFSTYLKTQSQKRLWLHTENQTTTRWLWPISLSRHTCLVDRAFWRALEFSTQLGSARTVDIWRWTLRGAFPDSSVRPKQALNIRCCGFD